MGGGGKTPGKKKTTEWEVEWGRCYIKGVFRGQLENRGLTGMITAADCLFVGVFFSHIFRLLIINFNIMN